MSNSVFTVLIKPDLNYIETFNDTNGFMIPNESYTITGTIEMNLRYPIQIRQLYVQFQGNIDSTISALDYLQDCIPKPEYEDEIPLHKWETIDTSRFGIIDKLSKRALGYANATATVIKQRVVLVDGVQNIPVGKSTWPFSLTIQHIHQLPPSLISPHHQIQYFLSARVKLNSLGERLKLSYRNVRMNMGLSDQQQFESASLAASTLLSDELQHLVNQSTLVRSKGNSSQVVQLYRHSYPGLHSLYYLPRIRYRGAREDHLRYEIGMSKFTCLQKKSFSFKCQFTSLCREAIISSIEYYLEQVECYPIRAGDYTNISSITFQDYMVKRRRKLCRAKCNMSNYNDGTEIKLRLRLDIPHISPSVDTHMLQITHKLRLLVRFENEKTERNMSLSFPLTIGTVPSNTRETNYSVEPPLLIEDTNAVHVRQELDQWLLTPDQEDGLSYFDELNKLPSYRDVLLEGTPPSPFIENNTL